MMNPDSHWSFQDGVRKTASIHPLCRGRSEAALYSRAKGKWRYVSPDCISSFKWICMPCLHLSFLSILPLFFSLSLSLSLSLFLYCLRPIPPPFLKNLIMPSMHEMIDHLFCSNVQHLTTLFFTMKFQCEQIKMQPSKTTKATLKKQ